MTKKDILELKRRFTKNDCTFTKMCGCYVNHNKEKVTTFNETFLNLEDEELFKYLEIAKKALSGTVGNNLLELNFPESEEEVGGKQHFLRVLQTSTLKNPDLLDRFYDLIIESYPFVGNYLILLFHDAYDVVTKTTDNLKLDESEEVYEYILCAICPVALSKPGLGYLADDNRIGPRIRDWVVGAPNNGFLFPSFSDRSSDVHAITYYVKDAKDSCANFIENTFGCEPIRTATEEKQSFQSVVKNAVVNEDMDSNEVLLAIQENIQELLENAEEINPEEEVRLTSETMETILSEANIPDKVAATIKESYLEEFSDALPLASNLVDEKALQKNAVIKKEQQLETQIKELQEELVEQTFKHIDEQLASPDSDSDDEDNEVTSNHKTYDVILRVKPEKANQIKSQIIGNQKCLIIPMEENEYINLNGINTAL